jgi:glycine cleavage system H protein
MHFAQKELGDIVYVEVETLDQTRKDEVLYRRSSKNIRFIFAFSCEVVEFNDDLTNLKTVNADPYGAGWMIKNKKVTNVADYESLLQRKHTKN